MSKVGLLPLQKKRNEVLSLLMERSKLPQSGDLLPVLKLVSFPDTWKPQGSLSKPLPASFRASTTWPSPAFIPSTAVYSIPPGSVGQAVLFSDYASRQYFSGAHKVGDSQECVLASDILNQEPEVLIGILCDSEARKPESCLENHCFTISHLHWGRFLLV